VKDETLGMIYAIREITPGGFRESLLKFGIVRANNLEVL